MKKWVGVMLGIMIIVGGLMLLRNDEDNWIKDSRGIWTQHGHPASTPAEVAEQQNLVTAAQNMFADAKASGSDLSSGPCLGTVRSNSDWVVDIVHDPRTSVDDLAENQCAAFINGQAHHFIELDLNGKIIRVV